MMDHHMPWSYNALFSGSTKKMNAHFIVATISYFHLDIGEDADKIRLDVLDELMGNNSPGLKTTAPSESCNTSSPHLYPDLRSLALGN